MASWSGSAGPTGASDTAYVVTATNAIGTSAPTTAEVELQCFCPPRQPQLRVATNNNGRRDDVLSLSFRGDHGPKVALRVNGKPYVLRVTTGGDARVIVRDRNRRRPTIYTVRYEDEVQRVVVN